MHTGAVTVIALFSAAAVLTAAAAARPRWRRRLPKVIGLAAAGVLAAFLVGRGVAEFFIVHYGDPASYRNAWGGPSLAGVFAVHSGPAVAILLGAGGYLVRRHRARSRPLRPRPVRLRPLRPRHVRLRPLRPRPIRSRPRPGPSGRVPSGVRPRPVRPERGPRRPAAGPHRRPPMIEAHDLTKRYGRTVAVDGLSFDVRPGTVTGFLGPNGSGKSTTMRMLIGLDRPDGGDARIGGRPYSGLGWPLREVGALLEAKSFQPGRSARAHLTALAASNGIPRRRVEEVLAIVGLEQAAGQRARTFSLGMAQRLGIATALLGDPGVLLLDEPVNGLDPEGIRWLRMLLRSLAAEGRTVFVSSHLISEMALTADDLIVVGQGRLLAQTTVAELSARASSLEEAFLALTSGSADYHSADYHSADYPRGRLSRGRLSGADTRADKRRAALR